MMGMVVKLVLGLVLFAGSLVGGLAATGRLNHEGTANIPILSGFFPAPPPPEKGKEGEAGKEGEPAADPHGAPADAHAAPDGESKPADASHEAAAEQDPNKPKKPNEKKVGKSVVEPEKEEKGGGHGGGGHGDAPADAHGAEDAHGKTDDHAKADDHAKPDAHGATEGHGAPDGKNGRSPEDDFQTLGNSLHNAGSQYKPGDMFRFAGMPAGVTPEQINEMWQKVQGLLADIDRRKVVLDQRDQELKELHEETGRRQAALATERVQLEQMQRELDAKIAKFTEQVKLVRNDEVAALKRNAQTLGSFEPQKAAELVETYWKSDTGQDQVLKTFEFMDKDAVNEIVKLLPNAMIQDVLKKRMRVSKEPATPGK